MDSKNEEELRELHTKKPLIIQVKKPLKPEFPREEHETNKLFFWISILIVCSVKTVSCWQMASILITAIPIKEDEFWCARPSDQKNISINEWINETHIWNPEKNYFDKCEIWITENETRKCEEWEFINKDSIIKEWQLVCDKTILIALQQHFYLLGIFTHGLINNIIMNKYAPRNVFLFGMICQTIFGVLISQSPNFTVATIFRYLTAISCGFMFTAGLLIFSKSLGTHGSLIIAIPASYELFWSFGTLTLSPLSMILKNWRTFQLCISVPTVILIAFSCNIPKIKFKPTNNLPKVYDISKNVKFLRIFGVHVAFSCTIVHFYGGLLNSKNWNSQEYLYTNIIIAGLAEFLGVILGILIMVYFSNKKWSLLGILLGIGGLTMMLSYNLPKPFSPYFQLIGFFGKLSIACSLVQMSTQMNEFFIGIKNNKFYTWSTICTARLFLLSAPFINYLEIYSPFYPMMIYGGLLIINSLAIFLLVVVGFETNNQR